jgi:CheY-like chemotaxis protein
MHKRILVAEESDTIRGVAETILRQNGYEVISVKSAQQVQEVLDLSVPDLVLVSSDLKTPDNRLCYEQIRTSPRSASIPMLVFADANADPLPLPQENVIPRPFDPDDLIERVKAFSGRGEELVGKEPDNPLGDASLDDDFLDAALGLDRIDVTSSEEMDKTLHGKIKVPASADKTGSYNHSRGDDDERIDSSRVESLIIQDESGEIDHQKTRQPEEKAKPSSTSKIEIMDDQYGLVDPGTFEMENPEQAHDYDWFIQSMKEEVAQSQASPSGSQDTLSDEASTRLTFADPASHIDPVTPPPRNSGAEGGRSEAMLAGSPSTAGVEKFIDEFKKEIESLQSDEAMGVTVETQQAPADIPDSGMVWEDNVEELSPEHIEVFVRELASRLAEKLADRIASKINADKLLQLIKNEIIAASRKKP